MFGQTSTPVREHFFGFLLISPPSAPSPPGYQMVAIAILSARPGGWSPSLRPCFAFVVRLRSIGNAGEEGSRCVGPVLTGCTGEVRIFSTGRSIGTKACSDGLGHLRRPLSAAVADRSDSGGRKPGRWLLFHSRSTPHHPFRPSRLNWACSAQWPPRRSGLSRRIGYEMVQDRAAESGSDSPDNPPRFGGPGRGTSGGTTGRV